MKSGFTISDLGTPEDSLYMQIHYNRDRKQIKLWQEKYIKKMAERYNITLSTRPPCMPMDYKQEARANSQDGDKLFDPTLFRSYVAARLYAVCGCRIGCCFTVRELAKLTVWSSPTSNMRLRHVNT